MKFAYTRLITEDVPALSSFYEKLLGVTPKGNDDYVELHPGGAILAIVSRGSAVFMHGGEWVAAANRSAIRMATRSTSSRRQCLRPDHPTAVPPVSDARLLAGRIGLQPGSGWKQEARFFFRSRRHRNGTSLQAVHTLTTTLVQSGGLHDAS